MTNRKTPIVKPNNPPISKKKKRKAVSKKKSTLEVWRPSKFGSPEEFEKYIKDYFDSITISVPRTKVQNNPDIEADDDFREPVLNNLWEQIIDTEYTEIPSILWLCEYLDIHRSTLIEYEEKKEFSNTIKKAKQRIEKYNAEQLYRKEQVTGIIFNLKNNFDWKDKTESDTNIKGSLTLADWLIAMTKTPQKEEK